MNLLFGSRRFGYTRRAGLAKMETLVQDGESRLRYR